MSADAAPQPLGASSRLAMAGCWLASGLILTVCLLPWLSLLARHVWLAELASHFTWQYCWVLPVCLLACWPLGRRRIAVFAAASLLLCVARVAPYYLPAPTVVDDAPQLRVLTQNVFKPNRRHDQLVELIQRERPDLFLLSEINQRWVDALGPIEVDYPYREFQLRNTRSGMAFYTRHELVEFRFEKLGPIDRYCAIAKVRIDGRLVTVLGMHPSLPRRPKNVHWRNDELMAAAELVAATEGPVILMGDLNTTPWSPVFGDLLRTAGLRNSMVGFGVRPTWSFKGRWPLLLPIDHVLHTPDLAVIDRRVGPDIGSDHRAVVVDLTWSKGR